MQKFNLIPFTASATDTGAELSARFPSAPLLAQGSVKVIDRFMQLLFTLPGSDRTDPEAGCRFLDIIKQYNNIGTPELSERIADCVDAVKKQIASENDTDLDLNEILLDAAIQIKEIKDEVVALNVNLLFSDNSGASFSTVAALH